VTAARPEPLPPLTLLFALVEVRRALFRVDQHAVVDQNTAYLRDRLARLGLPNDPACLIGFAVGVAELHHHLHQTGQPLDSVTASLLDAALQLVTSSEVNAGQLPVLDPDDGQAPQ
jgi:hypothetical protein